MDINEQARDLLLTELHSLSNEEINKNPQDNRWSIRQVAEHLCLMEGFVSHMIINQLENGNDEEVDDKPVQAAVDRSTKVEAPSFLKPSDEYMSVGQLTEKLGHSHKALLKIRDTVPGSDLSKKVYPHPVFGRLSLEQWIPFVGYHEKRHLDQLAEVKTELGF